MSGSTYFHPAHRRDPARWR